MAEFSTNNSESDFDYEKYFKQLLNVCDGDISSIALRFFPKDDPILRENLVHILKSVVTTPWTYCTRWSEGVNIHQCLFQICQSYESHFESDELSEVTDILDFHLSVLFAHKTGLLSEKSVTELCDLRRKVIEDSTTEATACHHLATQISAMLLKDPVVGSSILEDFISLGKANSSIYQSDVCRQFCLIFQKAVQIASDDLPYIDTLAPQAQRERIFTVLFLLSKLDIFSAVLPLPQNGEDELIKSIVNAMTSVQSFAKLVDDSKLQFATLSGQLAGSCNSSFCEALSKALLQQLSADFEDSTKENYSRILRIFSSLVTVTPESEKMFWLYLTSFTEKKTYVELFITCCEECLEHSDFSLLTSLLTMKPFSHNTAVWFLLLTPKCRTLSQILLLKSLCFDFNVSQQLPLTTSTEHGDNTMAKLKRMLTFLKKIEILQQKAESFDEMSQEKLAMQLEKCLLTSLLQQTDLAVIEHFLDIGELDFTTVIALVIELSSVNSQPSQVKSVRFDIPVGLSTLETKQLKDPHILSQIFAYYAYCSLRNITDAVYGCSVHLSPMFRDEAKYSTMAKFEAENYWLTFVDELHGKYRDCCTVLLDYGRTYCRLIYPLSLRLEVIENAFSLLFITYDHVHERIQDVAEEEFEGDADAEVTSQRQGLSSKGGSSMASSSVFTQSTQQMLNYSQAHNRQGPDQLVGCLANEFLFRDMLYTLNECTKELAVDVQQLDSAGVSFALPTGHHVSLTTADDVALSNHTGRDSVQQPSFKDRLYRIQRAISEALWRMSVISVVAPAYGVLQLKLSKHEYFKRDFKNALSAEWENQRRVSTTSAKSISRSAKRSNRTNVQSLSQRSEVDVVRSSFVEKLSSSLYMIALCWSANRRDLEHCEQILTSYPDKFDPATSDFYAEIKFQRHLQTFIADVLLIGSAGGNAGKRLSLAVPFESPSKLQKANRSSFPSLPTTPTSSSVSVASSDGRMSALNQLVATSLAQIEVKDKLELFFKSESFASYVTFLSKTTGEHRNRSPFIRPGLLEEVISNETISTITSVDLAFSYSPNIETAAALLSNFEPNGLVALQTLLATYMKYINISGDEDLSDVISNSLKWFTSPKLIQPDWTPSGVLVSPLFNANPDHVAKTRSGIMSLSRLISMTSSALDSSDHDRAEAMLTQLVTILSADWVETAGNTIFKRATESKRQSKVARYSYLSLFWSRLREMYKSLGELGLQTSHQYEVNGPLDLLSLSPESIFSQLLFSMSGPNVTLSSSYNVEEMAQRLNVDLLQTISSSSCAQLTTEAHEFALEHTEELFSLAVNEILDDLETKNEELSHLFSRYRRNDISPNSSVASKLWLSCSETDPVQFAKQPSNRLNYQTAKLIYDRNDRLFVLVAFLSDFAHLLEGTEDKRQPEITAVKSKLASLKAQITENLRPLLTYMSISPLPLLYTLKPKFPSSLDSILLQPSTNKAVLLISDQSAWFTSTILRALINKNQNGTGYQLISLFDLLPDSVRAIPSVRVYRDMQIITTVESFMKHPSADLDLARVTEMTASISDPFLRIEIVRKYCYQFTLSGFEFLMLTCPIPRIYDSSDRNQSSQYRSGADSGSSSAADCESSKSCSVSRKDLADWLRDWQKRVDLWMRLSIMMNLDPTTTTMRNIQFLIENQPDVVAESLISARDFSTGLQLLNICGSSAFPVPLATRLLSAYLEAHMDDAVGSPEQEIRVVQQLSLLSINDMASSKTLIISFLKHLVDSSTSASSITMAPDKITALVEFCKTENIRSLLGEDAVLIDKLDQMVEIAKLLTEDLKEQCGPLVHKPLLLVENLLMNVKVEAAAQISSSLLKSPLATDELEISIQNIVAVYAFKALELPSASSLNESSTTGTSTPHLTFSQATPQRRILNNAGSSSVIVGSSPGGSLTPQSMTRPFLMPLEAPVPERWANDAKTGTCMACHRVRFSMFLRRHHCRRCGRIVCSDCSRNRTTVRGEPDARVCDDCYAQMLVIGEHSGQASAGNTPGAVFSIGSSQVKRVNQFSGNLAYTRKAFRWQLTTNDDTANSTMRQQFSFESAPNLALCLSILSLCRNPIKSANLMLQIVSYLSKYLKPTREIDAALVLSIMKQLLMRAKVNFTEHSSDISAVSGLATMCDNYSKAIDFLDSLLQDNCQPIPTVNDLIGRESSQRILSQLLSAERFSAAVRLASLMRPELAGNTWLRWGLALIRVGCFDKARQKISKCLPKTKSAELRSHRPISKQLREIVTALEGVSKRYPNIVADLVSEDRDKTATMTIRDLLAEPPHLAGKGALTTDPLPKVVFDEAVYYLNTYGNHGAVITFFQRHGYWPQAARFILDADCQPEVFVSCLLLPAASAGRLLNLEDQMLACDPSLLRWEKYIAASFQHLNKSSAYNLLHRLYVFSKDYIRAAYVCLRYFFPRGAKTWLDLAQNIDYLHQARGHLEAYIDRSSSHWGKVEPPTPKKPTWNESALLIRQFLPQPEVQRLSNAISLQFEVIEVMKARSRSNPNAFMSSNEPVRTLFSEVDSDKMAVVNELLMSASLVDSFALARRIVTDFRLDPRVTYGNLGHELARNGNFDRLRQLLICLRDVLNTGPGETSELIDDIICAAVRGIHDRPEYAREQDALIAMLSDDDAKIEASLLCGKLRSAYLVAIHTNRERDVRRISEAATRLNQPSVKQICDQWLEQFNKNKALPS